MSTTDARRVRRKTKTWGQQELLSLLQQPMDYGANAPGESFAAGKIRYLRITDIGDDGSLRDNSAKYLSSERAAGCTLSAGDLVFARSGATVGKTYLHSSDESLAFAGYLIRARVDPTRIDPRYLFQFTRSPLYERWVQRMFRAGAQPNINAEEYGQLLIPLPSIEEQRRIADALAVWDRAIQTAEALVATKRQLYEAARQRLIDDHQRNAGGDDGWQNAEFGDLAEELSERNRGRLGASSVMGVLKAQGIVPMREHVMASDLDRYLVVPPSAFAYNPMRLNIGSIAQSAHSSDVLVSPDYVVFSARVGEGSAAFLRHFIGSKRWRDTMELAASGSVRLRIYFEGLAEMTLRAPSLHQQERIAMVLDAAQAEIALANKKLESLRAQKRGLMQKLLTGEWRLPANASEQAA
jgi:type I restriction enzyme, S subunit